jgi:ParB-like chromosome segregation protein Spo0J
MNSNQQEVMPEIKMVALDSIHKNPDNPRIIKDDKFKKLVASVIKFPEMLSIRPVVVDSKMMILGGNMRYEACKSAGLNNVPIIMADTLSEEQKIEFIAKDNISGGEWNWEQIANDWDLEKLDSWGLDIPELFGSDTEKIKEKEMELVPYKKVHVLISLDVDSAVECNDLLDQLRKVNGVEVETKAN